MVNDRLLGKVACRGLSLDHDDRQRHQTWATQADAVPLSEESEEERRGVGYEEVAGSQSRFERIVGAVE